MSISAIVPFRNAADTIGETLRSILAKDAVSQILLIDHELGDASAEICRGFQDSRIRMLSASGGGISRALNVGLDAVATPYFLRCDADDVLPDFDLPARLRFLEDRSDHAAISGRFDVMTEAGRRLVTLPHQDTSQEMTEALRKGQENTHLGTFLIRTGAAQAIGGFREWFVTSEDLDFQYRLAHCGRVYHSGETTYRYRLRKSSISHSASNARRLFYHDWSAKCALQRSREGSDVIDRGEFPDIPDFGVGGTPMNYWHRAAGFLVGQAWHQHAQGEKRAALRSSASAIYCAPGQLDAWVSTLKILLKPAGTPHR